MNVTLYGGPRHGDTLDLPDDLIDFEVEAPPETVYASAPISSSVSVRFFPTHMMPMLTYRRSSHMATTAFYVCPPL